MKRSLTLVAIVVLMVVLAAVVLTACIPSDYTKTEKKLEEAGYLAGTTSMSSVAGAIGIKIEGSPEHEVWAAKGLTEYCAVLYYSSSKDAKAAYNSMKENMSEDSKLVLKKSGKVVFIGTEAAYKVF